ncbi:MAG: helicase HerA-like domain-containing protein [Bacteroidota bacterium]
MAFKGAETYIAKSDIELHITPEMANRHGLIAGATGTGKTVTLQVLAESFSLQGVPVFMTDIKGDLCGVSKSGVQNQRILERIEKLGLQGYENHAFPVCFWDVFGEQGHPMRTTISEMGPLLLSRLLNLNETQEGVLNLVFKIADDNDLLLLDLKDLTSLLEYAGNNRDKFTLSYGNISAASIGSIQRNLLVLEQQGAAHFFGEPAFDISDLLQTDPKGKGILNILAAGKLMQSPRIYSTFLLWLLSELFEELPEAGDLEKPKLVFFFDEAHLLFNEAPKILLEKIEQVVRLIRSKGVGVYFISQNPLDIPDSVLGQLGNRVQHALRAFTPRDQKAVKAAATTFRVNPKVDVESAITELGVGEALVSFLDQKGIPMPVERAFILPPCAQIGPITPEERSNLLKNSLVYGVYEKVLDRESAFEVLNSRVSEANKVKEQQDAIESAANDRLDRAREEAAMARAGAAKVKAERELRKGSAGDIFGEFTKVAGRTVTRTIGSEIGRQLVRGLLGSIFGGSRKR